LPERSGSATGARWTPREQSLHSLSRGGSTILGANSIAGPPGIISIGNGAADADGDVHSRKRFGPDVKMLGKPATKRQRLQWTKELHELFVSAVEKAGGADLAMPKQLLRFMPTVEGLSRENVASHLQKYRSKLKSAKRKAEISEEPTPPGERADDGSPRADDDTTRPADQAESAGVERDASPGNGAPAYVGAEAREKKGSVQEPLAQAGKQEAIEKGSQ